MQQSILTPLLVFFFVCLVADFAPLLALSHPDVGVAIELQHPGLDLKPEAASASERGGEGGHGGGNSGWSEVGGSADEVVSTWNEQVLEWDELTRCIRGSETGNAIERWLDCLESLEEVPALKPLETAESQQLRVRADGIRNDAEVYGLPQLSEGTMGAFDPLLEGSPKSKSFGSSDGNSEAIEDLGSVREDTTDRTVQEHSSGATQELEAADVSEDQGFATVTTIGHGGEIEGVAQFRHSPAPSETEMLEYTEMSSSRISSGIIRLSVEGDTRGASDIRGLSSKRGADISRGSDDSRSLPSR